ncbi:MAG: helical backbone metal receptor [Stagnimonas sp.]|nr:helical backbone metal receptor [Stagnimonas sp.]
MRVVSHTCSNTEIVCALGCAEMLVGVDADSDHPPEVVRRLPRLGRDLSLDVAAVVALKPDLVLTSLTLPGHAQAVSALQATGLRTLVCEPLRLDDVYRDIHRIADALGVAARGRALVEQMQALIRPRPGSESGRRPKILLEWWPKPVIAPTRDSWASELIELAGGENPWGQRPGKSAPLSEAEIFAAAPDAVVMSWCGVPLRNYRPALVRRRPGWSEVPAVKQQRIQPISEAFLGRPGPRLVEGYRALCELVERCS